MSTDRPGAGPDWPPRPPASWARAEPVVHPRGAPAALALLLSVCALVIGIFFSAADPVEAAVDHDPIGPGGLFLHLPFVFLAAPLVAYLLLALVPGAVPPWVTALLAGLAVVPTQLLLWDAPLLRLLPQLSDFVLAAIGLQLAAVVLGLVAQWRHEERLEGAS